MGKQGEGGGGLGFGPQGFTDVGNLGFRSLGWQGIELQVFGAFARQLAVYVCGHGLSGFMELRLGFSATAALKVDHLWLSGFRVSAFGRL